MKIMFIGVIIVAGIILAVLLGLNFYFNMVEQAEQKKLVQDNTSKSNLIENSIPENDDEWKEKIFPELHDKGEKKLEEPDQNIEPISDKPIISNEDFIKVYVKGVPEYAPKSITMEVIYDALSSWEKLNPSLKFEIINKVNDQPTWFYRQNSDVQIKWVTNITNIEHLLGQTETTITEYEDGTITTQHEILIDLADVDCEGNVIFWNKGTITDTIKHELGHALEIEHSSDINNLMYGFDGKDDFDTKGYVIPQTLGDQFYIGQRYLDEECFVNSDSDYRPYD